MLNRLIISIVVVIVVGVGAMIAVELSGGDLEKLAIASNGNGDVENMEEFDRITLHGLTYEKERQGPVGFSHKKHALDYELNCWECHHDYKVAKDKKKNIWSPWAETEKCDACHDPIEKKDGAMNLMAAFHLNCKTCHEEKKIYRGEPGAYKDCGKCHLQGVQIENRGYEKDKMGPVTFQHRKHEFKYMNLDGKRIGCTECHHEYVDGENVWTEEEDVKSCGTGGCHDRLKTEGDKQYKLRNAFHRKCKICHRDVRKAGKSEVAPYKKCSSCHRFPK